MDIWIYILICIVVGIVFETYSVGIITYLSSRISNQRYVNLCKLYVGAVQSGNIDDVYHVLDTTMYVLTGRVRCTIGKYVCTDHNVCPVCREDMIDGESIITLPCGHYAKQGCMEQWLNTSSRCMMCNKVH